MRDPLFQAPIWLISLVQLSEEKKSQLFLDAVDQFGSDILENHEDARDDLIISACALDAEFASLIRNAVSSQQRSNEPVEISSDEEDEDDEEDQEEEGETNSINEDEEDDIEVEEVEEATNDTDENSEEQEDDEHE